MHRLQYCPYCAGRLSDKRLKGSQRLTCEHCRRPVYRYPLPATCVVATNTHQQILLVKRRVEPLIGQWCLPGGFMQPGESPERAALRDLKEISGLKAKIELLLGVTTHPGEAVDTDTILMIGYLVTRTAGEPNPGDDASELAWFPPAGLPPLAFPSHRHFIRLAYAACTY